MGLLEWSGVVSGQNKNLLHCMAKALKELKRNDASQVFLDKNKIRFSGRLLSQRNFKLLANIAVAELSFAKQNAQVQIAYKMTFRWMGFLLPLIVIPIWALMGTNIYTGIMIAGAVIVIGYFIQISRLVSWLQNIVD